MKGAAKAGWGTMLKRLRKKKGKRKKKNKTKTDIHILWIKNPSKGKKKKEASPTIDRILNAVNLSFNIYSNRKIEAQV